MLIAPCASADFTCKAESGRRAATLSGFEGIFGGGPQGSSLLATLIDGIPLGYGVRILLSWVVAISTRPPFL